MLNWLVTFRNYSTGELLCLRVKATTRVEALDVGTLRLAEARPDGLNLDAWLLFSINRTEP
jgi:hypothetical protein